MKQLLLMLLVFVSLTVFAETDFEKQASGTPELIQKGPQKEWCPICGMSIKMYYKTSHAIKLKNGSTRQYCSIHCLASDMDNYKGQITEILVTDAKTEKLIDAKKAFYVIGSSIDGTMSKISKIAFASEADAKYFQKEFGGNISDFKTALTSAKDSMPADADATSVKRQKVVYPIGEKVYKSVCKPVDPGNFEKINNLKAFIKSSGTCGNISEQQLQAVALYLWDVFRTSKENNFVPVNVPADAKCPVCGMFPAKYPRWAVQLVYEVNKEEKTAYFDGVKDMMKFYLNPKKYGARKMTVKSISVTDYYSQKAIDGKTAYYVTGSDVYGPMGDELIPFSSEENSKAFMQDHNGKAVTAFNSINSKMLK